MGEQQWERELRSLGRIVGVTDPNASAEVIGDALTSDRDTLRDALRQAALELNEASILLGHNIGPSTGHVFLKAQEAALAALVVRPPQAQPSQDDTL